VSEPVSTLLICERPAALTDLRMRLESRGIQVHTARTCGDAVLRLWSNDPPHLVFTETRLADGTWADVVSMAERSPRPLNVIVVSRIADLSLYLQVLERGAFDFIVPPLDFSEFDHVVRSAVGNALVRRALEPAEKSASSMASLPLSATQEGSLLVSDDLQSVPGV
jgi:DNA-binding NtrC family response regulator